MARPRRRRPTAGALAPLLAWMLGSTGILTLPLTAAAQPNLEYEVKAAFLLNFTKFIQWPARAFAAADSPFTICVLGKDPFGRVLDETVAGESVGAHKLAIRRIDQAPPPTACQMVFFGSAAKEEAVSPASLGPGILTVGEGHAFAHEGGIIAFVIENRRVRFDINQAASERAALKLSSKLLNVARSVEP